MKTYLQKLIKKTPIKVTGDSMIPILLSGDIVSFKKISYRNIRTNDILLLRKEGRSFVHRVIYKSSNYFIAKGDNNINSDGRLRMGNIVGKVVKVKRGGQVFDPVSLYLIQSSHYFQQIIKMKKILEGHGIDFVFLKGLPLHLYYEKSTPQRLYADCDILIDRKNFDKVRRLFLSHGYHAADHSLAPRNTRSPKNLPEMTFVKSGSGFPVHFDIHLELVFMMTQIGDLNAIYPKKMVESLTETMLASKKQITINGEEFPVLDEKYFVIYLALHFFHHNFKGVHRLQFIDMIIRKIKLNRDGWLDITSFVNRYRIGNFVCPAFILAKNYFQTPIPDSALKMIDNDPKKVVKTVSEASIFDEEGRISSGIRRFFNIFDLSPYPLWKKSLVFFDRQVIYFVFFALRKKLSYFSKDL